MALPSMARTGVPGLAAGVIAPLWIAMVSMLAAPVQAQPELAVIGGVGVPGSRVAMGLELRGASRSGGAAVAVQVDFPEGAIAAIPGESSIVPRLRATHTLADASGDGFVAVDIAPEFGSEDPLLDDGALAPVISSASLVDDMGGKIAVRTIDGGVTIVGALAAATQTPLPSATSTPTQTRSPTNSPGPTFTVRSASGPDGCAIDPGTELRALNALGWLAAPLSLWWARRRRPDQSSINLIPENP